MNIHLYSSISYVLMLKFCAFPSSHQLQGTLSCCSSCACRPWRRFRWLCKFMSSSCWWRIVLGRWSSGRRDFFPIFFATKATMVTWWHGSKNDKKNNQMDPNGWFSCGKTRPSRSVGPMNVQWYLSWTIANLARWASKGTHLAPASTERNQLKTLISIDIPCSVVDFQSSVLFQKDCEVIQLSMVWRSVPDMHLSFNEVSQFLKIKNQKIPEGWPLSLPYSSLNCYYN